MYIDPTGYGFWSWVKSFWKSIAAVAIVAVTVAISVVAPQIGIPMLQMEWTLGIIGGINAAARGGDIQSGVLFGVTAGAIGGLGLGAMGPAIAEGGTSVFSLASQGAVAGAAGGATTSYAGGKGDILDIVKGAALGSVTSAIICGAMGVLQGHPVFSAVQAQKEALAGASPVGETSKATTEVTPKDTRASSPGTNSDINKITPLKQEQKVGTQLNIDTGKEVAPSAVSPTEKKRRNNISLSLEENLKSILSQRYKPYRNIKPGYAPSSFEQGIEYMITYPGLFGW